MAHVTTDEEFIHHLREEKLRTQQIRTNYTIQKLVFVTGLMGLGSLTITGLKFTISSYLLLLAPWVATAFDFYIMGEDYSVKRIGTYLKSRSISPSKKSWETWVGGHRDPFAPWAMPLLTTIVYVAALLISNAAGNEIVTSKLYRIWVWTTWIPSWLSFLVYYILKQRVKRNSPPSQNHNDILTELIQVTQASDYVLTDASYAVAAKIFQEVIMAPPLLNRLKNTYLEYDHPEFLACVDRQGHPIQVSEQVLEDHRKLRAGAYNHDLWFKEETLPDGQKTLLITRWLCHAVGYRHKTVQLFLDHPLLSGQTLLQVRGLHKAEAPASFDLPAAGHVSQLETVEQALRHELKEELGLNLDSIDNLDLLGQYNYSDGFNTEYRTVYRGRLNSDDLLQLDANDEELAAIATFPVRKIDEFIKLYPERVATGLSASFHLY